MFRKIWIWLSSLADESVDDVTSSISNLVDRLETVRSRHAVLASEKAAEAAELKAQANDHVTEASRAAIIAKNLNSLVTVKEAA